MTDPDRPEARLRTRTAGFFMMAALPAILVSGAASVVLHRLVAQEIADRNQRVASQSRRIIEDERARIIKQIERLKENDAVKELIFARAGRRTFSASELAPAFAAQAQLDILALVERSGPKDPGTVLSSAHLARAVGDEGPKFLPGSSQPDLQSGVVLDYVDGNPPVLMPALVSVTSVLIAPGRTLLIYGGVRLDGHRLNNLAQAADATLRLTGPNMDPLEFKARSHAARGLAHTWSLTPLSLTEPKMTLSVTVHAERLKKAQQLFATTALLLVIGALFAAILAASLLARRITTPILELSEAARRVGAGDLDVSLVPRSKDEVGGLVRIFNRMTSELKEARLRLRKAERVAAWQQIARRVAHEIKNPLFPMQMSMETLQKSYRKKHPKLDEIVEESTRTVLEEVRALNRIVTEFSDFARLPSPKLRPEAPRKVLDHVLSLYGSDPAAPKRVELAKDISNDLPLVTLDREQIGRALINLVKNALEALPEDAGRVTLDAQQDERQGVEGVCFRVTDTGPGMPDDVKERIFTPYFTTKAQGTGLGLAIVDRIVDEHRGQIEVDSTLGHGTTFTLFIPIETASGPAEPAASS